MTFSDTLEEKKHCITVHPELCGGDAGALLPPTCRLFRHRGLLGPLWTATRLFRTHFPKWRWQAESESLQVCVHDGGLSRRQLEQEVCWHESWHPEFCRDTDLRKNGQSKFVFFFSMRCSAEQFLPLTTLLSICQKGGPDKIPWCTPADRSPAPRIQSLHRHRWHTETWRELQWGKAEFSEGGFQILAWAAAGDVNL